VKNSAPKPGVPGPASSTWTPTKSGKQEGADRGKTRYEHCEVCRLRYRQPELPATASRIGSTSGRDIKR
jgi:hypothetical protein